MLTVVEHCRPERPSQKDSSRVVHPSTQEFGGHGVQELGGDGICVGAVSS